MSNWSNILASDNILDQLDIGFYGTYDSGAGKAYAGIYRDASDNKWKFFVDLDDLDAPTTTVNTTGLNYADGALVVGNIEVTNDAYISNRLGIGISSPIFSLHFDTTDAILVPKGTTAERPSTGVVNGLFRYNTQKHRFEGYINSNWKGLDNILSDDDQDTKIDPEASTDDDKLRFYTAGFQSMVLDDVGRLGIGVSSPSELLEVNGNVKATTFITVSDRNIKTNIKIIDPKICLKNINNLDVFEYNFTSKYLKSTGIKNKMYQGLIAQEVEKILPIAIESSPKLIDDEIIPEFKSINQNIIISQLLGAVKELTVRVEKLENEIKRLKEK